MRDVQLYQQVLGLQPPWTVDKVELNLAEKRVDVWLTHPDGFSWPCPKCNETKALYDHDEERVWRHLDTMQLKTFLHARAPRVNCPEHGVLQVRLTWAEPQARFTQLFERLAIDVLKETDVKGAGKILGLSWDEAWHIKERAVQRGLKAKEPRIIPRLTVDEKAIAKGQVYFTIVCDEETSTVEFIGDGRTKESLDAYYKGLTPEQLTGIQAVGMDMWDAFLSSTLEHVPNAREKIVFDRYHIMRHVNDAVDEVRRREHRTLLRQGDETLKETQHMWRYAEENLPGKYKERFASLKALNLKTGRAWALKESLRVLWEFKSLAGARRHWQRWYHWAMCSRLPPMKDKARMIKDHLQNVLTFAKLRITTATSEGVNSKIETVKKQAYGFRNREHFKTAILFHCGGLQLYPGV